MARGSCDPVSRRLPRQHLPTMLPTVLRQFLRLPVALAQIRADFWEGDATKHFSVKKRIFSEKGGGDSVNQGFGKDFYRKGNSVKRFGPFSEPPDSEN